MYVLFIAYFFPPDSSSGSFRPLFFANHLAAAGVQVHVLTAQVEDYLDEQTHDLDQTLVARLHPSVKVTRCAVKRPREALFSLRERLTNKTRQQKPLPSATTTGVKKGKLHGYRQKLKDLVTELLTTPDPHIGWLPDCVKQGKAVIATRRPDLIYATGSPWSSLLAGRRLKQMTGVPLLLDFRDPWTNNPAQKRSRLMRRLHEYLESYVIQAADGIIANTPVLREALLARYTFLGSERITTITNGFEEYLPSIQRSPDQPLTITHIGALYFSRNPRPLLEAVKMMIEQGVIAAADIRLEFVGRIDIKDNSVAELLASAALHDVVRVVPHVSYDEAQHLAQAADVLLLIQPNFPLQIPRKLYEYMAARKPMLCLAESASATARMVIDNNLGMVSGNTVTEIAACLKKFIDLWQTGELKPFTDNRCDPFKNRELSTQLCEFITELLNHKEMNASCSHSK